MAIEVKTHDTFVTTTSGLRMDILPMLLWEKAKKLGIWNPSDFDFTQDAEDWRALSQLNLPRKGPGGRSAKPLSCMGLLLDLEQAVC